MKVTQHPYLSAEAVRLRRRDGTPPWGVHPCEVDSLAPQAGTQFHACWVEAAQIRKLLEQADNCEL